MNRSYCIDQGAYKRYSILGSLIFGSTLLFSTSSFALTPAQCEARVNDTRAKLQECLTPDGISRHLIELQKISVQNGGRAAAGPGHDKSAQYIKKMLEAAGYFVTTQNFKFQFWEETAAPEFQQISPVPTTYEEGPVYVTASYAGSGDITAKVQAVGAIIDGTPPVKPTAGGCAAADFANFTPGNIALIQRGGCDNRDKARNAIAAGAIGLIGFNWADVNVPNTLQEPFPNFPVFAYIRYSEAIDLYRKSLLPAGVTVRMKTETFTEERSTYNVIADGKFGQPNSVVMAGAHLDSVGNAGINDNGTGSAAILEMAIMMKNVKPLNRMRFAWWSAEEAGLVGSEYYASKLTSSELNKIKLYLNYDMIGSLNHIVEVYYVDTTDPAIPKRVKTVMDSVTNKFNAYFKSKSINVEPQTDMLEGVSITRGGRSDHGGFVDRYIPVGGLFTGAEAIKTPEQFDLFGGLVGKPLDPCYHRGCDVWPSNVNLPLLKQMTDAVAAIELLYLYDKQLGSSSGGSKTTNSTTPTGKRVGHWYK